MAAEAYVQMKGRRWWREVSWRYLVAVAAVVYAAFPIVYILSASLSPRGTLTGSNELFADITTAQYEALFQTHFPQWIVNTLVIGGVTAIATVLMASAAAYAFSRFRFAGRNGGLTFLLLVQMFPQILAFVAIFLLLLSLRDVIPILGLNSRLGLICVYLGGALGANTFLMFGFFNSIPKELDEAAKIDGAGHARIFFTIILRLVAPVLAVVALLSFVGTFSDYIIAGIVLQDQDKLTIAVGLYQFISGQFDARWGIFAAGAVISALPVLLLFLFLQRYIVGGLTAGSVKG
ncbi:sugar ABC transporter permease [Occultella aeris]|uniref:Maltose transport system permease protein MalG n=1 Tax=Occultella aeris TaxID=2761496 RepID=A0A7M4DQG0_9MICO|nr:sugar ABC transporter permease [Occultella aeris]VZO39704.1 Maltose transport system permease protein MalG [Occultella aeris]